MDLETVGDAGNELEFAKNDLHLREEDGFCYSYFIFEITSLLSLYSSTTAHPRQFPLASPTYAGRSCLSHHSSSGSLDFERLFLPVGLYQFAPLVYDAHQSGNVLGYSTASAGRFSYDLADQCGYAKGVLFQ